MNSSALPLASLTGSRWAQHSDSSALARHALLAGVLTLHALAAWGLMQRLPMGEARAPSAAPPMLLQLIAATSPPAAPTAPRSAPRLKPLPAAAAAVVARLPQRLPELAPAPASSHTVTPHSAPSPAASLALAMVDTAPAATATAPSAAMAAAAPAQQQQQQPRTLPASALRYLAPPAPVYPAVSRRLGESGRVLVRLEIDDQGRVRQAMLASSSGSSNLDEAALAAVRRARFRPHTDNGEPVAVWTTLAIIFALEDGAD